MEAETFLNRYHKHTPKENQYSSYIVKHIKAPVDTVWSFVRRFDLPQRYKLFVSECNVTGEVKIGCIRKVNVKTGLPATTSIERLDQLDDEQHILGVSFVDGDHMLKNYSSIVTVHPVIVDGIRGAMVIESFIVDVPKENTPEDINCFVKLLINRNMESLANVSEQMAEHEKKSEN